MVDRPKRREFLKLIGVASAAVPLMRPLSVLAQQRDKARRIGVLLPAAADDAEYQTRVGAFLQALALLGWNIGGNVKVETRWAAGDVDQFQRYAAELAALVPDVILASSSVAVAAIQQATRTVPTVFVAVVDPVGAGFVAGMAHPGANTTGFTNFEYGLSGKWLELCREVAPQMTRAAVLRDPASPAEIGMFAALQSAAPLLGVELSPFGMHDAGEIERDIGEFARVPSGGLIVVGSSLASNYRELIITLAARHRLPAVYPDRLFVTGGGLTSYGPDRIDQFRRAAEYVDRILKGEKPGDLPVQAPTKYELVINLKTAKALGLDVPATVLVRADEVIE
jgi:putative ABC transport system substrate-binding protein